MTSLVTIVVPSSTDRRFADAWLPKIIPHGEAVRVVVVTSSDAIEDAVRHATGSADNATVVRCPPGTSIGQARNLGMAASDSPILAFADADDEVDLAALLDASRELLLAGADLAIAGYREAGAGTARPTLLCPPQPSLARAVWSVAGVWRFAFRRDFLLDRGVRFPDLSSAEDIGFLLQVVHARPRTVVVDRPWYTYRIHSPDQASQRAPASPAEVLAPIGSVWRIASRHPSPHTVALAADWTARIAGVSLIRAWRDRRAQRH